MGMQVTSLSFGSGLVSAPLPDFLPEKREPLPAEKKAAEQAEAAQAGGEKAKSPELNQTASALEQISLALNRRLKFVVDEESREILIKVIDNETDKVIKVLPPEELQRLHSRIRETIGFLIDRMV